MTSDPDGPAEIISVTVLIYKIYEIFHSLFFDTVPDRGIPLIFYRNNLINMNLLFLVSGIADGLATFWTPGRNKTEYPLDPIRE